MASTDVLSRVASGSAPEWLPAQMPPGYQTRFAEIQRLSSELHGMDRMGRLLWESGPALVEAVREALISLKLDTDASADGASAIAVKLDSKRRLLIHVQDAGQVIEKKSPELARAFQILHETAGPDDRVVLTANPHRDRPPASRPEAITPEALALLGRIGVNVMTTATLFAIWTLALTDQPRGRTLIDRLHAQDGGAFQPSLA